MTTVAKSRADMHVKDYEMPLMVYPEYRGAKGILLYLPPVILGVGVIGNCLSFVILSRSMNRISTYFYLAILAGADLTVLVTGLMRKWTGELTGYDIRNHSDAVCKLVVSLSYTFSDFSVWLIVVVTIERYIAVCHPLKASVLCSVRRARWVTLGVFLGSVALNLHFLWTVGITLTSIGTNSSEPIALCEARPPFTFLLDNVWLFVDAGVYSLCPCLILGVLNTLIVKQVARAKHSRYLLQLGKARRPLPPERCTSADHNNNIRLTSMLLAVSFAFMFTTLPNSIGVILNAFLRVNTKRDLARVYLVTTVTEMVMYLNHAINFFLYCAAGHKFRRQIARMLCQLNLVAGRSRQRAQSLLLTRVSFSGGQRMSVFSSNEPEHKVVNRKSIADL